MYDKNQLEMLQALDTLGLRVYMPVLNRKKTWDRTLQNRTVDLGLELWLHFCL